jgi:hypothetical protein
MKFDVKLHPKMGIVSGRCLIELQILKVYESSKSASQLSNVKKSTIVQSKKCLKWWRMWNVTKNNFARCSRAEKFVRMKHRSASKSDSSVALMNILQRMWRWTCVGVVYDTQYTWVYYEIMVLPDHKWINVGHRKLSHYQWKFFLSTWFW